MGLPASKGGYYTDVKYLRRVKQYSRDQTHTLVDIFY